MTALIIGGAIFLISALLLREWQTHNYKKLQDLKMRHHHEMLSALEENAQNTLEELYLLKVVLAENDLINQHQLADVKKRLDEGLGKSSSRTEVLNENEVLEVSEHLPLEPGAIDKFH